MFEIIRIIIVHVTDFFFFWTQYMSLIILEHLYWKNKSKKKKKA